MAMAMCMAMGSSRVTAKFQITLPSDVRQRVRFRPGEVVDVDVEDEETVRVHRSRKVRRPLDHLVGRRSWRAKPVRPDEVDEMAES